jgi:2-aminoadipate transaminase
VTSRASGAVAPTRREEQLVDRISTMRSSAVRELLKVTSQPDVISFAGGLPAPELFPVERGKPACWCP